MFFSTREKMTFLLNNREERYNEEGLTIAALLSVKRYSFKLLVVRINGELVRKEAYASTMIRARDDVQVLHLMSGG